MNRSAEIEKAWVEVQQDMHNADFKNQVFLGKAEVEAAYKTGFVDGVKWSIKRFS